MNIKALIPDSSRQVGVNAANAVLKDPSLMPLFFKLAIAQEKQYSRRASYVIETCQSFDPKSTVHLTQEILKHLPGIKIEGVKRSFLKMLSFLDFSNDEEAQAILLNHCFDILNNAAEAIAVRMYSAKILFNIAQYIPEIKQELISSLEFMIAEGSPGLKSVGRNLLKELYSQR